MATASVVVTGAPGGAEEAVPRWPRRVWRRWTSRWPPEGRIATADARLPTAAHPPFWYNSGVSRAAEVPQVADQPTPVPHALRRRLTRIAIWAVVGVFAWFALTRIIGAVDWGAVAAAFGLLDPLATVLPMFLLLLLRQVLNAVPLMYYVPGLGWFRSVENDLAANVVATFAPPPGDIVLRVAMFRSWGLDPVRGMTGVTLNSFKFYAVRFLAPVIGLVLLAGFEVQRRQWVVAVLCLAVSAAILAALVLLLRSDALAELIGRIAGRLVRLVKRSADVSGYPARMVRLRHEASDSLRRGLLPSMIALVGMVLADASILAVALRGVGLDAGSLPLLEILGWVLLCYPLTTLPLFGLGVLEAIVVGAWTLTAGVEHEASIVAATIVWRAVTILGTLALGGVVLAAWRLRYGRAETSAST